MTAFLAWLKVVAASDLRLWWLLVTAKYKVGVGVAKGADVQAAVAKATSVAKKHLITLPLNGETIPHDSEVNSLARVVLIKQLLLVPVLSLVV